MKTPINSPLLGAYPLKIRNENWFLLPDRALYWPKMKLLAVSDLHWGKSEVFRFFGIPIPKGSLETDLTRLNGLIEGLELRKLVILGDLTHSPRGVNDEVLRVVNKWREEHSQVQMIFVPGNHDRSYRTFSELWKLEVHEDEYRVDSFAFRHDPPAENSSKLFTWCGHIHPMLRIRSRGDRLRLPCFLLKENFGILPAFGRFTGGYDLKPTKGDEIYLLAKEEIIPYPAIVKEYDRSSGL